LEDNIDSLTKDASDLKNVVNRLIDNKQTPSIHSDLLRQRQSKPTNATPASSLGKSMVESKNAKMVHGTGPKISNKYQILGSLIWF
jgi:regulator of replication initiation timing